MRNENKTKPSVLVIDDDPFIHLILKETLCDNFQITILSDCMQGMSFMKIGNIPDIIVSDLNLPGIDGLIFLDKVKNVEYLKEIPFIVLSGNEDPKVRIKCLESGAYDFIRKPFTPKELKECLINIFEQVGKTNNENLQTIEYSFLDLPAS
jgi:CheY-like chemotaxis protein